MLLDTKCEEWTYFEPSFTNAMAITIRFRRTSTTKNITTSKTAAAIPIISHVFGFENQVLNNKLRFVLTFTSVGGRFFK